MVSTELYSIKLETFEGPLDLLLYLIKKNEVNIYDIPIAVITEQYLLYLEMVRELNLEIVGDYLMIAAELGLIKSKMLLPKPEIEEEEKGDPRAELVRKLLEYQRYKQAAGTLLTFDILNRDVFIRTNQNNEKEEINQFIRTDMWSLINAFRTIWIRNDYASITDIKLELELLTLDQKVAELVTKFKICKDFLFEELFDENPTRFEIVITFLAVLELIKSRVLIAIQDLPYSSIKIVYIEENGISAIS